MADEQSPFTLRPSTFFSVVVQIFVSMYLVLMASSKSEDHWLRIAVMVYLILMMGLYIVAMFLARRQERRARGNG
jgi:hypothetical protein